MRENWQGLKQRAKAAHREARAIETIAREEDRELTTEEARRVDDLVAEANKKLDEADRAQELDELERREMEDREKGRLGLKAYAASTAPPTPEEKRAAGTALWFGGMIRGSRELMLRGYRELGIESSEARAAMQEDTLSEGGYAVPTPIASQILWLVKSYGIMRRIARILPMESKTLNVPEVATKPAVTIVAEEGTIAQSEPTLGTNLLTAKKLIAYSVVSKELAEDSIVPIGTLLLQLFAEAIAGMEDFQALEGDGTGQNFTGLKTALTGAGFEVSAVGATNLDKYIEAMATVGNRSARALENGSWIFSPLAWMKVQQLKTAVGDAQYYLNAQPSRETPLSLLGRPVYLSDKITVTAATPDTASGYFGDFQQGMLIGQRSGVFSFVDPYTLSTTWQSRVYVGERVAINVALPDAFVEITGMPCE
jgi:HK97 family phage major capsid protein